MVLHGLISALTAALIGAVAWRGSAWTIGLTLLIPILVFAQPCRASATTVALVYYAAASWPLMESVRAFWSLPATSPIAPLAWTVASFLLVTPWIALWSPNPSAALWRCPLAFIAGALPPLGLIGWASPLTAAGVLFPGTGWFGLAAILFLPGALLHQTSRRLAIVTGLLLTLTSSYAWTPPSPPNDWTALNTNIDTARRSDPVVDYEAIQQIQTWATHSSARFLLTPESAVMRWNEATEDLWHPTIAELQRQGKTLLLGTSIAIPGGEQYENVLLTLGAHTAKFVQRNPVPFAMWKPFGPNDGTTLRLTGPGTLEIAGHRAAVLICYEQLLVWPILHSALERPTIILGLSNDHWVRNTTIPQSKKAATTAWSRLFGLSWLAAANS